MTLRRRFGIASIIAVVAIIVVAIVLTAQFLLTASTQRALFEDLAPAADDSAALLLAQTEASSAVSDYLALGNDRSLAQYGAAIARADALIESLSAVVNSRAEQLSILVSNAADAQRAWITADADPALRLMAEDKPLRAARVSGSNEAWAAYDSMITATSTLNSRVDALRFSAAEVVSGFTLRLGITLLLVGILVTVGVTGLLAGVQRWVLVPLTRVRSELRAATGSTTHEEPIAVIGPPEIAAVARDAEALRRSLVHEIDEAKGARDGLLQDAPLVAAMHEELRGVDLLETDQLLVVGTTEAAEGVLSGDWWEIIMRPDGTTALVIADASGHGPEASVAALRVRTVLRSALEAGLPLEQVASMGAHACSQGDHFVTSLVVETTASGLLRWVNAGHQPGVLVTASKEADQLSSTGPLLSVLGGTWSVSERQLLTGDLVVLFTDGLVESRSADGEELGVDGLTTILRGLDGHVRANPTEALARVVAQARLRAVDWRRDDVTLAALLFRG